MDGEIWYYKLILRMLHVVHPVQHKFSSVHTYVRTFLCVFAFIHVFVVGSVYEFEAPKTHHIPYLLTAETLFLHQNNTLFNLLYRNERNFFGRIHSQYFIILQNCATSIRHIYFLFFLIYDHYSH